MIINEDWKWTNEAKEKYSPDLIDLVEKLLTKDPATRLGTAGDAEEVLGHAVFKTEVSADKVTLKPTLYDFDQDFLSIRERKPVAAEFIDRTDYVKEKEKANAAFRWNKTSDDPAEKGSLVKGWTKEAADAKKKKREEEKKTAKFPNFRADDDFDDDLFGDLNLYTIAVDGEVEEVDVHTYDRVT